MRIDSNGNVGIGTSSVTNALGWASIAQVGGANPALSLKNSSDVQWDVANFGGTFAIYNGSNQRLKIDSSGNVGIGTSSPQSNLQVLGTLKVATGNDLGILGLGEASGTTVNAGIFRGAANNPTSGGNFLNLGGYDGIVFAASNAAIGSQTERMRISTSEVVINEPSADTDFRVESDARTHMFYVDSTNSKIGVGTNSPGCATGGIHLVHDATEGTPTFAGGEVGVFQRNFNSAQNCSIAIVSGTAAKSVIKFGDKDDVDIGKIGYNNADNSMRFTVSTSEKMVLADAGVIVGKDTTALTTTGSVIGATGTATFAFDITSENESFILNNNNSTGTIYKMDFRQNNSSVGRISVGSSSTSYGTSSDYRLKENVTELTGATARLKQLTPKRFNFIAEPDVTVDGFLAHEVSSIVPEAITGEKMRLILTVILSIKALTNQN